MIRSNAALARVPAEIVIFDDCGHVPHRQYPDAVLRVVATFVGKLEATGSARL